MNTHVSQMQSDSVFAAAAHTAARRVLAATLGVALSGLLASQAYAGGADVSADAIYSDDVTLTTYDGAVLDINSDGEADLAVAANAGGPGVRSRYYLGNGDGTFGTAVLLPSGGAGASSEIVAGELTGDAFLDVVQGRRDLTDLLYIGDGVDLGPSQPGAISADALRTLSVALGDLDNDGDLDMVTSNGRPGGVPGNPPGVNRFYLNDGLGVFTGADISADLDDTRTIALADMDGDGDLDVLVGNDETTVGANKIYMNQFVESGNTAVTFAAGIEFGDDDDQTARILVGDLDGDGDDDIVTLNNVSSGGSPGVNRFFINDTTLGIFALSLANDVTADTDSTSGGALADFDGDGDLDLAVANLDSGGAGESPRNRLYLNQVAAPGGAVTFAAGIDISTDEDSTRELAAFDLDGDGDIDLVAGNQNVPDRRYLNNGTADPFTNVAPVIDDQAAISVDEDTAVTIQLGNLMVTDPDNVYPVDFTLTVMDGTNYTHVGNTVTPGAGFAGDLTVPVIVNDGTEDSAVFNLTVTVENTNNVAPTFTSTEDLSAVVDEVYTYNIVATDADAGDALTITAPTLPAWLTFTDNGGGLATLTGTPTALDVADHPVSLEVTDGTATDTQDFTITVELVASNTPPVFDSTAVTSAMVGAVYTYDVMASDDDADTLAITAPILPAWLTLTDNADGTATLTGTPAAGDLGDHDVRLTVSDGTDTAEQDFTITVTAAANNPPSFTSTAVTDATAGTAYSYSIVATDPDGDPLTITAPTLPAWLTLTDNGDGTATLAGTPAAADVGDEDVSLEVSDGTDSAMQDFTITVDSATTPPPPPPPSGGGGGGGSLGFLSLLALIGIARRRFMA